MISGIYKLTFSSGRTYIGKSIDIPTRWKQHYDKFLKGTAARNMQSEYNTYGAPEAEVIYECHPDHIDLMEAFFIARLRPELNITRPTDPFPGLLYDDLDEVVKWFKLSTLEHAKLLNKLDNELEALECTVEDLEEEVELLRKKRKKEEIAFDVNRQIEHFERKYVAATNTIEVLQSDLTYARLPWWKKLFN